MNGPSGNFIELLGIGNSKKMETEVRLTPGSAKPSRCRKDKNKAVAKRRRAREIADRSKRLNWRLRK